MGAAAARVSVSRSRRGSPEIGSDASPNIIDVTSRTAFVASFRSAMATLMLLRSPTTTQMKSTSPAHMPTATHFCTDLPEAPSDCGHTRAASLRHTIEQTSSITAIRTIPCEWLNSR